MRLNFQYHLNEMRSQFIYPYRIGNITVRRISQVFKLTTSLRQPKTLRKDSLVFRTTWTLLINTRSSYQIIYSRFTKFRKSKDRKVLGIVKTRRAESGGIQALKIAEEIPRFLALDSWSYSKEISGSIIMETLFELRKEGS